MRLPSWMHSVRNQGRASVPETRGRRDANPHLPPRDLLGGRGGSEIPLVEAPRRRIEERRVTGRAVNSSDPWDQIVGGDPFSSAYTAFSTSLRCSLPEW